MTSFEEAVLAFQFPGLGLPEMNSVPWPWSMKSKPYFPWKSEVKGRNHGSAVPHRTQVLSEDPIETAAVLLDFTGGLAE